LGMRIMTNSVPCPALHYYCIGLTVVDFSFLLKETSSHLDKENLPKNMLLLHRLIVFSGPKYIQGNYQIVGSCDDPLQKGVVASAGLKKG